MSELKSVCIFCGSSKGFSQKYEEISRQLGQYLAEQNIEIIYGAGNVGLMGVVADAALTAGGKVVGIIPEFLKKWEGRLYFRVIVFYYRLGCIVPAGLVNHRYKPSVLFDYN